MTTEFKVVKNKQGAPTGALITPVFRGSYIALFQPKTSKKFPNSTPKYSMAMLFPKGTDFTPLKKAIMDVATAKWGSRAEELLRKQQNSDKKIFRDQGETDSAGFEDGCIFINASNKTKPGLVGRKAGPDGTLISITDEEAVWSGDYFMASINPYATGFDSVQISLNNVQLIKKGDRLGGGRSSPSDEFEAMDETDMENLDQGTTAPTKGPFD